MSEGLNTTASASSVGDESEANSKTVGDNSEVISRMNPSLFFGYSFTPELKLNHFSFSLLLGTGTFYRR